MIEQFFNTLWGSEPWHWMALMGIGVALIAINNIIGRLR